jgi:predicted transcriptional regulator
MVDSSMAKKKTTVYLDSEVLTATKAAALTSHRSESAVIEDALRSYLRSGHGDAVRDELGELLARVASTSDLDEDTALAQAVMEVRATRRERRARTLRGG